jgi:toxin FitB
MEALQAIAVMTRSKVVDLNTELSMNAAKISIEARLPTAESIILATARAFDAILLTQDADFENVAGVKYVLKMPDSKLS